LRALTAASPASLSDRMKTYLDGLTTLHDGELAYRGLYANYGVADRPSYPRAEHPMVRTHPAVLICPACPAPLAKRFLFIRNANRVSDSPSRPLERGVGHRHERWGGMRWPRQCPRAPAIAGRILPIRERFPGRADERCFRGRQNRVVLTPQRLASSLRRFCEPNRANKTIFAGDGVKQSPIAGESTV
jgi:hypothetical protein